MSEHTKIVALLGVLGVLLCLGFVSSVRITEGINHAAKAEAPPAAQAPAHG